MLLVPSDCRIWSQYDNMCKQAQRAQPGDTLWCQNNATDIVLLPSGAEKVCVRGNIAYFYHWQSERMWIRAFFFNSRPLQNELEYKGFVKWILDRCSIQSDKTAKTW